MIYKIDLLLACTCIKTEEIESVFHIPDKNEWRFCLKHQRESAIIRIGTPYPSKQKRTPNKIGN